MVRSVGKSGVFKSAPTGMILGWDVQSNAVNKMHALKNYVRALLLNKVHLSSFLSRGPRPRKCYGRENQKF